MLIVTPGGEFEQRRLSWFGSPGVLSRVAQLGTILRGPNQILRTIAFQELTQSLKCLPKRFAASSD
jgi:hypothetical protein